MTNWSSESRLFAMGSSLITAVSRYNRKKLEKATQIQQKFNKKFSTFINLLFLNNKLLGMLRYHIVLNWLFRLTILIAMVSLVADNKK